MIYSILKSFFSLAAVDVVQKVFSLFTSLTRLSRGRNVSDENRIDVATKKIYYYVVAVETITFDISTLLKFILWFIFKHSSDETNTIRSVYDHLLFWGDDDDVSDGPISMVNRPISVSKIGDGWQCELCCKSAVKEQEQLWR